MKITQPRASIKPQVQTMTPTTSDSIIMDDTIVTMDSSTALMGGLTVTHSAMRQTVTKVVPRANIKVRR